MKLTTSQPDWLRGWPVQYERHVRNLRLRSAAVFAFVVGPSVRTLGPLGVAATIAASLIAVYSLVWLVIWLGRHGARAGKVKVSAISRASTAALRELSVTGLLRHDEIPARRVFLGGLLSRDGDGWLWQAVVRADRRRPPRVRIDDRDVVRVRYVKRRGGWLPEFGYLLIELTNGQQLPLAVWDARRIPEVDVAVQ